MVKMTVFVCFSVSKINVKYQSIKLRLTYITVFQVEFCERDLLSLPTGHIRRPATGLLRIQNPQRQM